MFQAFYSDPHFFHKNIIKYTDRPFSSVSEMHTCLIDHYNSIINDNDYVLWLGDVTFAPIEQTRNIINKLNGKKVLIKGNHDKRSSKWFLETGFSAVTDSSIYLMIDNNYIRTNHYPYAHTVNSKHRAKCPNYHKGEILLHGHVHSKIKKLDKQIHVGVDAWNYYPVTIEQIRDLINA